MRAGRANEAVPVLTNAVALDPRRTSTWIPLAEAFALADQQDAKLGPRSTRICRDALARRGLAVRAFCFWELEMLAQRARIVADAPMDAIRADAIAAGVVEIAAAGDIVLRSCRLAGFHKDPADRIIVAGALSNGATPVTADEAILRWKPAPTRFRRQDARK